MDNLTVKRESVEFEVKVRFDLLTGQMEVSGCDKNPIVALGMLDYALARVRRFLVQNDIAQEVYEASRIVPARGPLV